MGNVNPFGLGGIPKFSEAITAKFRARVQDKGGGNYQFTFEMSFSRFSSIEISLRSETVA